MLPLYPQYSATTTAAALDRVDAALAQWPAPPERLVIEDYHAEPGYIAALAASIRAARAPFDHLLFSFHGIPQRYADRGDPYGEQCLATARLVAGRLALAAERWSVAFQSRVGRRALARALHGGPPARARRKPASTRLAVACPGFAVDCLETLEEIAIRGSGDLPRRRRHRLRVHSGAQRRRGAGGLPRAARRRAARRERAAGHMIGRFHEVSVHAPDPAASLAFYERLGFTQVTTGEAFPYPYAVVADGRLAIGLHGRELPQSPLLAFVLPDLRDELEALERRGIEILDRRLGDDVFNEASLEAGGQSVRLLEARTHSPPPLGPGETSRLGWFEEYALPVADVKRAEAALERLGFVPAEEGDEPYPHIGMTSDSLNVALLRAGTCARPALVFTDAEMPARIAKLAGAGFEFARRLPGRLDAARHALLVAPEGTQFLLTTVE